MAEWVENGSEWALVPAIGGLVARAHVNIASDGFGWAIEAAATRRVITPISYAPTLDAAKAAAQQALREMHASLSEHFAPVLRWSICGDQCDATLGDWILIASTGLWVARHESGLRVTSDPSCTLDAEQARRAAEAALRSLGVAFRTEGE